MKRKIIQIATAGVNNTRRTQCDYIIIALCDDGTVWQYQPYTQEWEQTIAIPQPTTSNS